MRCLNVIDQDILPKHLSQPQPQSQNAMSPEQLYSYTPLEHPSRQATQTGNFPKQVQITSL